MFYSASVLFSVGGFLYLILCPALIRSYRSYADFDAKSGSGLTIIKAFREEIASAQRRNTLRENTETEEFVTAFVKTTDFNRPENSKSLVEEILTGRTERLRFNLRPEIQRSKDAFAVVRERLDDRHPWARLVCTALYGIGSLLALLVAVQGLWAVLRILVGW